MEGEKGTRREPKEPHEPLIIISLSRGIAWEQGIENESPRARGGWQR